ncbi:SdiA-regulated domain-containing protein [Bacteroidota bacterium]
MLHCQVVNEKSYLNKYEFNKEEQVKLSNKLSEISGLTMTPDGRLFCHDDEEGIIYQINISDGKIIKEFYLGGWPVDADFEGLAYANNNFYLITSDGILYECNEGEDKTSVNYEVYKTGASSSFDVEGLCYEKETNSLLLACKEYPGKNYKNTKTVYSFSLNDYKINKIPRYIISLKELDKKFKLKNFNPSGIEFHPSGNSIFLISAKDGISIIELSKSGDILAVNKLNKKAHRQPEGITFLSNGTLLISDEGTGKKSTLTKYYYKDLN